MTNVVAIVGFMVALMVFLYSRKKTSAYVLSKVDDKLYQVRDLNDKQHAANTLATLRQTIYLFSEYLYANQKEYPEYKEYINNLYNKIKDTEFRENSPKSSYSSYSVNKGEELVFCLRSKNTNEIHDTNTLMFVTLHELAHIACPEYNHTDLFHKIFRFFRQVAMKLNIYKYQDYSVNPVEYCGININQKPS